MRVLVTGGAGFIGSNLAIALTMGGNEVGIIDDLSSGKAENLSGLAWFREMDILDPALDAAMAEFAPEAVVHLAAQPSVSVSMADPDRDWAVNVEGTRAVARAAAAAGAKRVVSASSAAVYGEPAEVPLKETSPKAPANPYGRSKLAAEAALAEALQPARIDFASLRFANVFGPRQDAQGEGGVVSIFASKMIAGQLPVIYGDGTQTRDFIFVGDVVSAIITALFSDAELGAAAMPDGPAYNVSTGKETPINELAGMMATAALFPRPFAHEPAREGDVARSALDPAKASAVFDWQARADLEAALKMTLTWFRGHA
jgi:UDP-glucose 4-epimerase